jgi:hypothetical protein
MKILLAAMLFASPSFAADKPALRCGWVNNETPGNYTLTDKDGEWIIGVQGGHQAEGDVANAPNDNEQVNTNGSHGYWCACITATVDTKEKTVLKISSSKGEKLAACTHDKNLKQDFVPTKQIHSVGKALTECTDRSERQIGFHSRQACVNQRGEFYYLAN